MFEYCKACEFFIDDKCVFEMKDNDKCHMFTVKTSNENTQEVNYLHNCEEGTLTKIRIHNAIDSKEMISYVNDSIEVQEYLEKISEKCRVIGSYKRLEETRRIIFNKILSTVSFYEDSKILVLPYDNINSSYLNRIIYLSILSYFKIEWLKYMN